MLAAEYETLPPSMQAVVLRFFDDNERWLEGVLEVDAGRERSRSPAPRDAARLIVSAPGRGQCFVAHSYADVERFRTAATALLAGLSR